MSPPPSPPTSPSPPPTSPSPPRLDDLSSLIWAQLTRATADRRHPWRWPVLSTVTLEGAPSVRMVVVRQVDTAQQTLSVYTDARSAKVGQIARDPRVSLLFWHPGKRWQLRADGIATISEDRQTFEALAEGAKADYGATPAPGVPLESPGGLRTVLPPEGGPDHGPEPGTPGEGARGEGPQGEGPRGEGPQGEGPQIGGGAWAFRRLTITLSALDWLSLATQPPARAILDLRSGSQSWVAP